MGSPPPPELIREADGLAGMQAPLSFPRDKGHACPPPPRPTVPIPEEALLSTCLLEGELAPGLQMA